MTGKQRLPKASKVSIKSVVPSPVPEYSGHLLNSVWLGNLTREALYLTYVWPLSWTGFTLYLQLPLAVIQYFLFFI